MLTADRCSDGLCLPPDRFDVGEDFAIKRCKVTDRIYIRIARLHVIVDRDTSVRFQTGLFCSRLVGDKSRGRKNQIRMQQAAIRKRCYKPSPICIEFLESTAKTPVDPLFQQALPECTTH